MAYRDNEYPVAGIDASMDSIMYMHMYMYMYIYASAYVYVYVYVYVHVYVYVQVYMATSGEGWRDTCTHKECSGGLDISVHAWLSRSASTPTATMNIQWQASMPAWI